MELTHRENIIFQLVFTKSFDLDLFRKAVEEIKPTAYEVNRIAYSYVESCFCNADESPEKKERHAGEFIEGIESSHMIEAIKVFIELGLDPNTIFTEDYGSFSEEFNIMDELHYVDNGYIAADTLALLLENGGNPSILLNGHSMVRDMNHDLGFDLINQENRLRYDSQVHFWMVLIGYGARLEHGEACIDLCKGFDCTKLRNHRNYYYGAIHSDNSNDHWEICFFDKNTNWEVARY